MKASLAAMAEAARIIVEADIQLQGSLLLTAHGRHESATNETLISLIGKGVHGDAVIVTELGGHNLPIVGMGLAFFEIRISGDRDGIHETVAPRGAPHPVMAGYRTVQLLQEEAQRLAQQSIPYLGTESIFVGRIQGGDYFNRLPASCTIAGTRRFGARSAAWRRSAGSSTGWPRGWPRRAGRRWTSGWTGWRATGSTRMNGWQRCSDGRISG